MASNQVPVAVAYGDGIGPEVMAASLHIMKEDRRASLRPPVATIGEPDSWRNRKPVFIDGQKGFVASQGE